MVKAAELDELLDHLARRFEEAEQTPAPNTRGWGQFLDAPKRHKQIGPYGTSAGIIVLALAGRGQSVLTREAVSLLGDWWTRRDQDRYAHERLVQTPRLAFFNLALRISPMSGVAGSANEVENALLGRLLPSGLWGNYWISDEQHDPTPRRFTSAIALLSLMLFRDTSSPIDNRILVVADQLEKQLIASKDLWLVDAAAVSAAVLATKGRSLTRKTLARIDDIALSGRLSLGEKGVYFYNYEHSPDADGQTRFGSGYFIVPTEILLAIAGFQPGAPSGLRLRAEAAVSSLVENLRKNDGAYRPDAEQRLSSKDQAWSAILLKMSSLDHKPRGPLARTSYALRRPRKGNWFINTGFPVLAMIVVTLANVLLKGAGLTAEGVTALATLLIGGLYGPKVLRRLIPGRE